jgi:predicted phosphate transport protein (TIGR00153 family)
MLKELLSFGKKEQKALDNMTRHVTLLCSACEAFHDALEKNDLKLMETVGDLEREGDIVRREIIGNIYEGAFLPYLRPNLLKFVETVDEVLDLVKAASRYHLDLVLEKDILYECTRIAALNFRMAEMLLITFHAMLKGEDLRDKTLAIRIYEKKIDDMKLYVNKTLRQIQVKDFWEGKTLSDFVSNLVSISDEIEDASDCLDIINVSMK